MKTEKISDVLQGMDVNTEDAIVTLSDKIWEIGSIDEITGTKILKAERKRELFPFSEAQPI